MNIAWHGNYLKYFEVARCNLLQQIAYSYGEMKESGYAWPIIEVHVRYIRPTRFGQDIAVRARIVEYELRLKIDYLITDVGSGERLTRGHSVQVAVDLATKEMLFASPLILYRKLGIDP